MRVSTMMVFVGLLSLCGCATERLEGVVEGQDSEAVGEAEQALTAYKGIILIDRTGSMTGLRSNGHTRCRDARQQALDKVDHFFGPMYNGSALSVWTFSGSTITRLTGYVGSSAAKSAINGLSMEGCTNVTPLAQAICQAADELYALRGASSTPNILTILTDGGENSSVGVCSGSSNGLTDGTSWQSKARARVSSYSPYVRVNSDFWSGSTWINLKQVDPETGKPIKVTLPTSLSGCSGEACDHEFFVSIAADTGGTYDLVKDNNTQYPCSGASCPPPYYEPIDW